MDTLSGGQWEFIFLSKRLKKSTVLEYVPDLISLLKHQRISEAGLSVYRTFRFSLRKIKHNRGPAFASIIPERTPRVHSQD